MTTYNWSTLTDEDIAFNPAIDVLAFDLSSISAADLSVSFDYGGFTTVTASSKTVTLETDIRTLTTANVTFADGSVWQIGDNTTDTANDDLTNTLTGGSGDDRLQGLGGNDTMAGGEGDDFFSLTPDSAWGDDTVDGGGGTDTLSYGTNAPAATVNLATGSATNTGGNTTIVSIEVVYGTAEGDTLIGGDAAHGTNNISERFRGGGGNDSITGGTGNGFFTIADYSDNGSSEAVNVNLETGFAVSLDGSGVTDTLINVDGVWGGAGDDTLVGGSLSRSANGHFFESFRGNAGDDILKGNNANTDGVDGVDASTDRADYSNNTAAQAIIVNLATGVASDGLGGTDTLIDIDQVYGGAGNDTFTGGSLNDLFDGGAGDDTLNGGAGDDTLIGGGGISFDTLNGGVGRDTADFSSFESAVWVNLANADFEAWTMDGPDLHSGTWRAIADLEAVENVVGTVFADRLFGNGLDNVFGYTSGGIDFVDGAAGNDTLDLSRFGSAVWVNLANAEFEAWTMDGPDLHSGTWRAIVDTENVESVVGTVFADRLFGNGLDNVFGYTSGGIDFVDGAAGNDTLDLSRFGSAVWVNLANAEFEAWTMDGPDLHSGTWRAIVDTENVESVVGTVFADRLFGNGLDNVFGYTSGGIDFVDGAAGNDTLDLSRFGSAVWVNLANAEFEAWTMDGPDLHSGTWRAIVDTENVESVVGTDFADRLFGNGLDNVFGYTSGGIDFVDGAAGNDTLDLSRFGSAVWVNLANAEFEAWTMDGPDLHSGTWRAIVDTENVESVVGTAFADRLFGTAGVNRLVGGAGNDLLTGAGGADQLAGGAGSDCFDYNAISEGVDTIIDFAAGAGGDLLDISDVVLGFTPGNEAGFVQFVESGGATTFRVDADGGANSFVDVALLQNTTGLLLNDMLANNNLFLA